MSEEKGAQELTPHQVATMRRVARRNGGKVTQADVDKFNAAAKRQAERAAKRAKGMGHG